MTAPRVAELVGRYAQAVEARGVTPYAGRELLVRLEYAFDGGSYYGANGAVWVDDVRIDGIARTTMSTRFSGATRCMATRRGASAPAPNRFRTALPSVRGLKRSRSTPARITLPGELPESPKTVRRQ